MNWDKFFEGLTFIITSATTAFIIWMMGNYATGNATVILFHI